MIAETLRTHLLRWGVPERYVRRIRGKLGMGMEGAVYDIGSDRVLKVNVRPRGTMTIAAIRKRAKKSWAATIHDSGNLHDAGYWYVMTRMYPPETKVAAFLNKRAMAQKSAYHKRISREEFHRRAAEIESLLPENVQKVVRAARRSGFSDIHGGNIMRTASGTYRFVDIESVR